jgi:hypothetical protein
MPIFGNIGLNLPGSGSEITSSFNVLPIYFASPSYNREAATIGAIEAFVTEYDNIGSYGGLSFKVSSKENRSSTGSKVMTMFATGSNNEPRVGIGFEEGEEPIRAFDIKSKIESNKGTELLIRSSRTTTGAQVGDEAGIINFVIDTGSFIDITTTGSIARIKTKVDEISSSGVRGRLQFGLTRNIDTEIDIMEMSYGDSTFSDFYATTTPRTFEIKDISPQTTPSQNASFIHSNGTNPYTIIRTDNPGTGGAGGLIQVNNKFGNGTIFLHGPTGEITGSDVIIDDWGSVSASLASKPIRTTLTNAGQISLTSTTDQYYHYAGNSSYGLGTSIFNVTSTASPTTITTGAGKYMRAGYVVPEDGVYNINFTVRALATSNGAGETTAAELEGTDYDFLLIKSEPSNDDPNMSIIGTAGVTWDATNTSYPVTGSVEINSQTLSKGDLLIVAMHGVENITTTSYIFHTHTIILDK